MGGFGEGGEGAKEVGFGVWDISSFAEERGGEDDDDEEEEEDGEWEEGRGDQGEKKHTLLPAKDIDALFSTLVIEHIPLRTFFAACSSLLRRGGFLLVTNMHEDMGKMGSQAGFTDKGTGEKVRGVSFFHRVEEVVEEAGRWGFEVTWGPVEREVSREDLEGLGRRAEKWVGVRVWWGIVFRKK